MKHYVFLTANIYPIGGMQKYIAGKAAYLKKQGWKVNAFFCGHDGDDCAIASLNEYKDDEIEELEKLPGEWTKRIRRRAIERMVSRILENGEIVEQILIESQTDVLSLWGELLAERLKAKNVCFVCAEVFRKPGQFYERYLDFFDFKHKRKELAGIDEKSLGYLFEGYKKVGESESYRFNAEPDDPIQDVESKQIDILKRQEWNICYLGRAEKAYVKDVIFNLEKLAKKHPGTSIQFIMVGNADCRQSLLKERLEPLSNVIITLLGDMVPIPRKLFRELDVVIAGAGSAEFAAREHVPTIVADCMCGLSNGIYGYTTNNTLFPDKAGQKELIDALEDVLINKIQDTLEFTLVARPPAVYYYEQHMKFIKESCQEQEYYTDVINNARVDYPKVLRYTLHHSFPRLASLYKRIGDRKGSV